MTGPLEQLLLNIRESSEDLELSFSRASSRGKGTPDEVSEFREIPLRKILQKYFPYPYKFTKGQIMDARGQKSASVDCLLLNPEHPNIIDYGDKHSLILADGVNCAIELKPKLTKDELKRAITQAQKAKKLIRIQHGIITPSAKTPERVREALRVPFFVFTSSLGTMTIDSLAQHIKRIHEELNVPVIEQFDAIIVNKSGILTNKKQLVSHPKVEKKSSYGYIWESLGENTLPHFILRLSDMDVPVPNMSTPIIARYLQYLPNPSLATEYPR